MAKIFKQITNHTQEHHLLYQEVGTIEEPDTNRSAVDIEAIRQLAYEQGYQAGTEALDHLEEQELSELKQQLERSLAAIPHLIETQRNNSRDEIAHIVLHLCQQFFIGQEQDPHCLEMELNQLLTQINSQQAIELFLHPKEINQLQMGGINLETKHLNGLKIKSDESLHLGGYVLKTEHGFFDANIEKKMDKLKHYLMELRQRGTHAKPD